MPVLSHFSVLRLTRTDSIALCAGVGVVVLGLVGLAVFLCCRLVRRRRARVGQHLLGSINTPHGGSRQVSRASTPIAVTRDPFSASRIVEVDSFSRGTPQGSYGSLAASRRPAPMTAGTPPNAPDADAAAAKAGLVTPVAVYTRTA